MPGLSITLSTTAGNKLIVQFNASFLGSNTNQFGAFQITVDGTAVAGGSTGSGVAAGKLGNAAVTVEFTLAAGGTHTVAVQWLDAGSGTLFIHGNSNPTFEHGSLLVEEVTV